VRLLLWGMRGGIGWFVRLCGRVWLIGRREGEGGVKDASGYKRRWRYRKRAYRHWIPWSGKTSVNTVRLCYVILYV